MGSRFLLVAAALLTIATTALQASAPASHSPPHTCDHVASTAGVNAGNSEGSVERPFRTILKLLQYLDPGETGCLRGTAASAPFVENVNIQDKNFDDPSDPNDNPGEEDRITIRSYPGEIAKLRGRIWIADSSNYITFSHLVLEGQNANNLASPRIDGNEVYFLDNNVSGNDTVSCFRVGPFDNGATRTIIRRNRIHNCQDAIAGFSTLYLSVLENLIYDNLGYGLRMKPNVNYSSIQYNIFDGNAGSKLIGGDAVTASSSNVFNHNISSNPTTAWNLAYEWTVPGPVGSLNLIQNSCYYAAEHQDPAKRDHGGMQWPPVGYSIATSLEFGDPQYRDRAANDFHLQPTSPCLSMSGDVANVVDAGGGPTDEQASADNQKPNVLFIVTDDQRAGETVRPQSMPQTIARLRDAGTEYRNGFATTPVCCPGRSSILTGRYAHNHSVHNNGLGSNLEHDLTLQRYLEDAGYRTGIFGKFLNGWDLNQDPPHWDRWAVFNNGHCSWKVNEQGEVKSYGSATAQTPCPEGSPYSADYIAEQATGTAGAPGSGFLDEAESNDSEPWFMYLAPFQPHGGYQPEYEYRNLDVGPIEEGAAHSEGQSGGDPITDKPQHIQWLCKANPSDSTCTANTNDWLREAQLRMLRSVDDMIGTVLDELERHGEQDTMIVFTSDNGFMWGEHGIPPTKGLPYTESIEIPFMLRYAPFTIPGAPDDSLVANIDLVPTALQATGTSVPAGNPAFDGISLLDSSKERTRMHTEFQNHGTLTDDGEICQPGTECYEPGEDTHSNWASTVTPDYQYTEYYEEDGLTVHSREYYAASDEDQLTNLLGDGVPANDPDAATLNDLSQQLERDRFCRGDECPGGTGQGLTDDPIDPRSSLLAPSAETYVCCRINLRASASDNLGVEWVQFYVDGDPVGAADTTPPYEAIWNSDSASQGSQVTEHDVRMLVRDTAGREALSAPTTIRVDKGLDVQIEDPDIPLEDPDTNSFGAQYPDTDDTITYSFGRLITPSQVVPGWDASMPADCVLRPPSCVTVRLINVPPGQDLEDSVKIETSGGQELPGFGTIGLRFDGFVGANQSFTGSGLELIDDGTAVRVTLGSGNVAARKQFGVGTSIWTLPSGSDYCDGCRVAESIDGADQVEDREF